MLKKLLEKYIQRTKNKNFQFDEKLKANLIFFLILSKSVSLFRGLRFYNYEQRGKLIFLGKSVRIVNKRKMRFGTNVTIGDYVKLSALGKGDLFMGNNVNIGSFSQVIISTSYNNLGQFIEIEDNVGIGEFSYIGGGGGTSIGANTIIGQYFSVHPENHNFNDTDTLIRNQGVSRQGIKIGKNCWIGSKVTILDGVTVGDNCVIAAGSVLNKSYGENLLIGGVPAKILKIIE